MASDTDTASPDRRGLASIWRGGQPLLGPFGSRLGRLIVALNLLGLAILVIGALVLNELRQGLINARFESLAPEAQVIARAIDQYATQGDAAPNLAADKAREVLRALAIPNAQRARLYDRNGGLLADTWVISHRIESRALPPPPEPNTASRDAGLRAVAVARRALADEVKAALRGPAVTNVRIDEGGRRVISVSMPIQHVRSVEGVLTLEAGDIDKVVHDQRRALAPFIAIAIAVTLISSLMLTQLVAEPVLRLARAADQVRLSRARAIALPDLGLRSDELGDLARALEDMTNSLAERMQATERFAADVAHELRNPMTSIRSAVETLSLVKEDAQRAKLQGILEHDVGRLERLITDISNASRIDAEMLRDAPRPVDMARLAANICEFYGVTARPDTASVRYAAAPANPCRVIGREGPLSQVLRNLIDNARSFSPPDGEVRVGVARKGAEIIVTVDDDGPGIPPENLETIFERFYTSRPKGAAFGGNSGLGLAICRQIANAHRGRVWAENRMEDESIVGARFTVALPAA